MPNRLDELERDALAELGNIGVGKASTALGRMLGGTVQVSVPSVEIVPGNQTVDRLEATLPGRLVAVTEALSGAISGSALLVFPERSSLPLASAALPPDVPKECAPELEGEALVEVGNIVLNSCLASMANLLGTRIETTLPGILRGTAADILDACGVDGGPEPSAILFQVTFRANAQDTGQGVGNKIPGGEIVGGEFVLVLDAASAAGLKALIGGYIGRILR